MITELNFVQALLVSLLGVLVVFFVLLIIMCFTMILGKVVSRAAKKEKKPEPAPAPAAPAAEPAPAPAEPAPVMSDGRVQLNTVSDRTAVMLMAIVADELGKPLDELQFVSIKEIGPAEGVEA